MPVAIQENVTDRCACCYLKVVGDHDHHPPSQPKTSPRSASLPARCGIRSLRSEGHRSNRSSLRLQNSAERLLEIAM
jgi:hypothetical protein